jgi:hypothetical protein
MKLYWREIKTEEIAQRRLWLILVFSIFKGIPFEGRLSDKDYRPPDQFYKIY